MGVKNIGFVWNVSDNISIRTFKTICYIPFWCYPTILNSNTFPFLELESRKADA
jgi:hypothetical protein